MHFVFKFKSVLLLHISNSTIRRLSKMEALYKMKKSGLGDRATRAKAKEISSKSKRADLLASKRRIPLSTLEVDNEKGSFAIPMYVP